METFIEDKAFYDIQSLQAADEFWNTDLDSMQEVLRLNSSADLADWNLFEKELPIVLQDKLMTDAALGTRPIKSEHSYSLASDGDSLPDSPISATRIDEMEDDTYSGEPACSRLLGSDEIEIKEEPFSETDSLHSSCSSSPQHITFAEGTTISVDSFFNTDVDMRGGNSVLKNSNIMLTANNNIFGRVPKVKVENHHHHNTNVASTTSANTTTLYFPPTPPSCSSSEESEDNGVSQPSSPGLVRTKTASARMYLSHHPTTTRQPIHTPLISSQPKGSTGVITLTEEEKRTLIAEGYPVPTRLPLTKAEEKSLKKIRRKIKNKISAQESRRKKKEYMDQLERKVEILVTENSDYRKQIDNLEGSNANLLTQLAKLQAIVARTHPHLMKKN